MERSPTPRPFVKLVNDVPSYRPNAGKLFIDFFLSDESIKIMAKRGELVNREGVKLALPGADVATKRFVQMDEMSREQYVQKKKEYKAIF